MRDKILKQLAHWHSDHPWSMLGVVAAFTVVMIILAGRLTVTMQVADLLPEGDPKVKQLNTILDEFATASNVVVVVQGEERQIKQFADELAPKLLELQDTSNDKALQQQIRDLEARLDRLREKGGSASKISELQTRIKDVRKRVGIRFFQRVDYKAEVDFLRSHGLLLAKVEDLENTKELFTDPNLLGVLTNLNNSMEKEYVRNQESISTRQKEDEAVQFLVGIENLVMTLNTAAQGERIQPAGAHEAVDQLLIGDPYFISYDNSTLIMEAI
ncbi:MAG: multidrug RND transporter, partial [Calditrichota bacterium]